MINMCAFEGSGTLIAIGVTLLLSGIVSYYCSVRLGEMEKTITKQNQIISDFLGSVQSTLSDPNESEDASRQHQDPLLLGMPHTVEADASGTDLGSDDDDDDDVEGTVTDEAGGVRVVSLDSEEDTAEVVVDPDAIPSKVGEMREMAIALGLVPDLTAAKALKKGGLAELLREHKASEGSDVTNEL